MQLDSEDQRANLLVCIRRAAASLKFDGSDASLAECAVVTRLRQEVEAAGVVILPSGDTAP